ncbi:hypothetical protein P8452_16714 [Trifolium repens]|jgi:hypothetical protein|nr:hypothetical protein P8452_16714 [Trifolium repens]
MEGLDKLMPNIYFAHTVKNQVGPDILACSQSREYLMWYTAGLQIFNLVESEIACEKCYQQSEGLFTIKRFTNTICHDSPMLLTFSSPAFIIVRYNFNKMEKASCHSCTSKP